MSPSDDPLGESAGRVELTAPAKLTTGLRVVGVRPDGFHLLDAEMVTLDLADTLEVVEADDVEVTVDVLDEALGHGDVRSVRDGTDNLVARALHAIGRRARVRLTKRIPAGAGLGGGSADAAAVLRWAGITDPAVAARLGADVPFCLVGGRARVGGIGEIVTPLPHRDREFVVLLLPFGVQTAAVYGAWDELAGERSEDNTSAPAPGGNDLEAAALRVEPRLARWRDAFSEATERPVRLAGSGSSWFVEGSLASLGLDDPVLRLGGHSGRMITARTVAD